MEDYVPDLHDLPEGLALDEFQSEYGGLGGEGTQRVVDEINRRLGALPGAMGALEGGQ